MLVTTGEYGIFGKCGRSTCDVRSDSISASRRSDCSLRNTGINHIERMTYSGPLEQQASARPAYTAQGVETCERGLRFCWLSCQRRRMWAVVPAIPAVQDAARLNRWRPRPSPPIRIAPTALAPCVILSRPSRRFLESRRTRTISTTPPERQPKRAAGSEASSRRRSRAESAPR